MSQRYIVQSVSGYLINPHAYGTSGHKREPPKTFTVLDSLCCYRVEKEFNNINGYGGWRREQRRAHEYADNLNQWDDEMAAPRMAAKGAA